MSSNTLTSTEYSKEYKFPVNLLPLSVNESFMIYTNSWTSFLAPIVDFAPSQVPMVNFNYPTAEEFVLQVSMLSEEALAETWLRPEEDEAWKDL